MTSRMVAFRWLLVTCWPALAWAQENREAATGGTGDRIADQVSLSRTPTAEDVLKALQKKRPFNAMIPSGNTLARGGAADQKDLLLADGASVVRQPGRISSRGDWWIFNADSAAIPQDIKLLPNAKLETVVRTLSGSKSPLEFVITGEATVFQSENYLLIQFASRMAQPRDVSEPPTPSEQTPANEPGEKTAEEMVEFLRQQKPREEIVIDWSASQPLDDALRSSPPPQPDGTPLVQRPGRIVRDGSWWTFVFESDNKDYPELPMRLLPNRSVELMVGLAQHDPSGLVFLVSGDITVFDGKNFLLPRAVIRRIDMGNIRN